MVNKDYCNAESTVQKKLGLHETGSVKIRKTRHKISVDIRIFFRVFSLNSAEAVSS